MVGLRGRRLTVSLLAALVTVLVIGAGAAVTISGHRSGFEGSSNPAATPTRSAPARSGRTTDLLIPSNNLTVQLTPAARSHPRSGDVQQLLQSYFDAINQHDYAGWAQVVSPVMAAGQDRGKWLQAYATTVDSSIWMESMTDGPLAVRVRFVSVQDPELAPKDLPVGCIEWTLTYRLVDQAGQLALSSTVDGSVSRTKC